MVNLQDDRAVKCPDLVPREVDEGEANCQETLACAEARRPRHRPLSSGGAADSNCTR